MLKPLLLSIFTFLLLVSCKSSKVPTPDLSVTIDTGLNGIFPGGEKKSFLELLGPPDEKDFFPESLRFYYLNKGIEITTEEDQVASISYYFSSNKFKPFVGTFIDGINGATTIEELKEKLGEPEEVASSVISKPGEVPEETEVNLSYPKKGISFTFNNNKLSKVRQFQRKKTE